MSFIDFFYPKRCPVCLDVLPPGRRLICTPCERKVRRVSGPVCYLCGRPLSDAGEEYCRSCTRRKPSFVKSIAYAEYTSPAMRRMIAEVKYHGDCQLLDYPCMDFAKRYALEVLSWGAEALIPVPVHRERLLLRGYNQAEEIANRLSRVWGIPVDPGYISRVKRTAAQKELTDTERMTNLYDAFRLSGTPGRYSTVILVDDIYTTGSTLESCTRVLRSAGTEKVYGAVLLTGRNG